MKILVVGPEAPLADGIVDHFQGIGILILGPTKTAAEIIKQISVMCCPIIEQ